MSRGKSWVCYKKKGVLWETFEDLEIVLCSENCTWCLEISRLCCPFTFVPVILLLHSSSLACVTIPQGPAGSLQLGPSLPALQGEGCLPSSEGLTAPPPLLPPQRAISTNL